MDIKLYESLSIGRKLFDKDDMVWFDHTDNRNKKVDDPHTLVFYLDEITWELEKDVKRLMKQCINWERQYRGEYDSIEIATCNGRYNNQEKFLIGLRQETPEELALRLSKVKDIQDKLDRENESKEDKKIQEEKKLLEKLKAKYEAQDENK